MLYASFNLLARVWPHLARLRRHCHRHGAYIPTSNTTSHDKQVKINSWVTFASYYMGIYLWHQVHVIWQFVLSFLSSSGLVT